MSFEPYVRKKNTQIQQPQYDYTNRMIPAVTIPLGFLQQLIKQAQLNKILTQLTPVFRQEQSTAINDLINEIQNKKHQEVIQNEESTAQYKGQERKIQQFLLSCQLKFIQENPNCREKVKDFLLEYLNLQPHFWIWIKQIELKSLEDMLVICSTNKNGNRIQNLFKTLFSKLSIEYYQKYAYPEILKSSVEEKIKYLAVIGEILNKITKPSEYIYFN